MNQRYFCPECGELRMKTPAGAVCPNGHGRVIPGVMEEDLRKAAYRKWVSTLPTACKVAWNKLALKGQTGFYTGTWHHLSIDQNKVYRIPRECKETREGTILVNLDGMPKCCRKLTGRKK